MALITHEFPFSSVIVPKYNMARHSTEQAWQIGTHGYLDAGHMEISPATTDVYGSFNVNHRVVSSFDGTNGVPVTLQFPVPRRVVLYYGRRAVRVVASCEEGRRGRNPFSEPPLHIVSVKVEFTVCHHRPCAVIAGHNRVL